MGREIRNVPPEWQHPVYTAETAERASLIGKPIPLFDRTVGEDLAAWEEGKRLWDAGSYPEQWRGGGCAFEEWAGERPDPDRYRPAFDAEPTWLQMYETVSEGTPVTPAFASAAELVDWLVDRGECHGTRHEHRYSRRQAEAFVDEGWAPTMAFTAERGVEFITNERDRP